MKTVISFLSLSFLILLSKEASSQVTLPIIRANSSLAKILVSDRGYISEINWTISPQVKPDVFSIPVKKEKKISFITDTDSISFVINPNSKHEFIVLLNQKDSAHTRIEGNTNPEPVFFTEKYKRQFDNQTIVEIPKVYELMHIVFSLTKSAGSDIAKNTEYYNKVKEWFEKYRAHSSIIAFDSILTKRRSNFFNFKKDSYAFLFDKKGKIIQSNIYNRIASNGGFPSNTLLPFLDLLQKFADDTDFLKFYKDNIKTYQNQIKFYQDTAGVKGMLSWLNKNFPSIHYNCFKIIFSPLVMGNQSSAWFNNSGFNEAQAHVNFPYPIWTKGFVGEAAGVKAGNIVFTELNHAFINPEADKKIYRARIDKALTNISKWIDPQKEARNYNNSYSCINEYMNWALVSLRYIDVAPKKDLEALLDDNNNFMTHTRGFLKFKEFTDFIINLYRNKKADQVLSDLYPYIISWFETKN